MKSLFFLAVLFPYHDAKLDARLTVGVKAAWQTGFDDLRNGALDPVRFARVVHAAAAAKESPATDTTRGEISLQFWNEQ